MPKEIKCEQLADDLILVNGTQIRKDMNDRWVAKGHLTPMEAKFFNEYRETLERLKGVRNIQITYII